MKGKPKPKGYSQEEFSSALKKVSDRYGITVTRKQVPQEPTDKYDVKFIPKAKR